jgi:[acyl-carrier-protein] S-malonyltransferase
MMAKIAFLFPGQGAQSVGMGKDFYEASDKARRIYDTFNRIMGEQLSRICFEGPEAELKRTLYTQPAILATSLAALELFQDQCRITPVVAAGHSLGEYGALYAAGTLDLETAARLVQKRAELMENARQGAMSAVLGLPETIVEKVILRLKHEGKGPVTIANYNSGDQYVISGSVEGVAEAGEILKEEGARRVIPLAVGGAFHSSLMDEAAQKFEGFLGGFEFRDSRFPVITNVDAQQTTSGPLFREKLGDQINHSVYWTQSMSLMFTELGVTKVIEFGPGKVLTGMARKAFPSVEVFNVFDMASLQASVEQLRTEAHVS